jgi:histidinol dehydrogenase
MQIIKYPEKENWQQLTLRSKVNQENLNSLVSEIFNEVAINGDEALKKYTKIYNQVELEDLLVSKSAIDNAINSVSNELQSAINIAKENIEKFHAVQLEKPYKIETTKGVVCWRENRPIEKVGIYIPGGSAPLFSTVLMLGIPAKLAGCKEILLCTPPNSEGKIHPAILYAANLVGIEKIFSVGGIQAIAGLTHGTETISKVFKIFGPGNQYVTAAKQMALQFEVAIDMPAGPSEVLVIALENANPSFIAADLLAQAEHGPDSQVIFLSTNEETINEVNKELALQLEDLQRKETARLALNNSKSILFNSIAECIDFSNMYAPEHLIIAGNNWQNILHLITEAGSVFLGNYSCESAGDYASGTNHTLPTGGFARSYSGVSIDSFVKKITFQEISEIGIKNLGPTIELMAEAELLMAHKNAVSIRLNSF